MFKTSYFSSETDKNGDIIADLPKRRFSFGQRSSFKKVPRSVSMDPADEISPNIILANEQNLENQEKESQAPAETKPETKPDEESGTVRASY